MTEKSIGDDLERVSCVIISRSIIHVIIVVEKILIYIINLS